MRELTNEEVAQVNGGLGWIEGGIAVMAFGFMTPVTSPFGLAIGLSMIRIGLRRGE